MRFLRSISLLAAGLVGASLTAQDRHIGPVAGLASLGDSVYSASQAGIFVHHGEQTEPVCPAPFRITSLAAFIEPNTSRPFLLLGGGEPAESGSVALLDLATKTFSKLRVSGDLVYGVAIHPDAKEAAIACADNRVLTVSIPSLDEASLRLRQRHTSDARAVAYSPDGRHLLSGGLDGVLLLSSTEDQSDPLILQEHTAGIECVQFSSDSKYIASGARDARVRIHTAGGRFVRTFSGLAMERMETGLGKKPYVWALAWNRESSVLVAGTSRGTLHWLSRTDDTFSTVPGPEDSPIYSLCFDSKSRLFIGTETVTVRP